MKHHCVGTKIIPVKSSGHDKKRCSVVLCGFDDNKKAIPAIIVKNLKKVPAEVKNRKDCFVAVARSTEVVVTQGLGQKTHKRHVPTT